MNRIVANSLDAERIRAEAVRARQAHADRMARYRSGKAVVAEMLHTARSFGLEPRCPREDRL